MVTTIKESHPIARKEHICELCGCKINKGQKYYREVCNQEIYGGFPLHALAGDEKGIEIVGNIYDNPELKKK